MSLKFDGKEIRFHVPPKAFRVQTRWTDHAMYLTVSSATIGYSLLRDISWS